MVQVVATWVLGSVAVIPVAGLAMGGLRVMNGGRASRKRVPEHSPVAWERGAA